MPRSPRRAARTDWLRHAEVALAVVVLVGTWLDVGLALRSYPTWVYVGSVTLPFSVFPPTGFALVVLAGVVTERRRDGSLGRRRFAEAVLAVLTVVTAGFAVYNLNTAHSGLFVAGVFPMALGVLLALVVLAARGVTAARQFASV